MFNKIYKISFISIALIFPFFVHAQFINTSGFLTNLEYIVTKILIPLVFTLALLFFFYGVAKYIWSEGQGKADGRSIMVWGVVALFVMSSIWGLVNLLQDEFLVGKDSTGKIPTLTK